MLEKLSCSNLVACFMAVVLLSSCVDSSKLIKNIAKSGSIQCELILRNIFISQS